MHRTMRAVAAALILAAVGVGIVLAQTQGFDPFGPAQAVNASPPDAKATPPADPPRAPKPPAAGHEWYPVCSEAETRIEHALDQKVSIQAQDTPLGEVLERVKEDLKKMGHEIGIFLDKRALEDAGGDVGSDTPITCNLQNLPMRSALNLMFRDLDSPLAYVIDGEVLLITTEDVACEHRATRFYNVADLVTYRDEQGEIWTDYDPLIDVITSSVEPESWAEMGGSGTIVGDNFSTARVLVVTQTHSIHRGVADLLRAIRAVAKDTPGDGRPPLRARPKDSPPPATPTAATGYGASVSGGMGGSGPQGPPQQPTHPSGGVF